MGKEERLFSDKDRAIIFVRDRATCAFSGKNLWILDQGIIHFDWDWVDHIKPYSKGGKTDSSNGMLASSKYNYITGANNKKLYLYDYGFPKFRTVDIIWRH